jgi:hypothetical protein
LKFKTIFVWNLGSYRVLDWKASGGTIRANEKTSLGPLKKQSKI